MPPKNTLDYTTLTIKSGKGGPGSKHFRRAKYLPKGGPDGGNGGRGGHVILQPNPQLTNLLHLKYTKKIVAENGIPGSEKNSTGANGKDAILQVPLGTIVKEATTQKIKINVTNTQQKTILAYGGRGGKGNTHFKTSKKQSPNYAQPGEKGTELSITLELKSMADIGLVGLPNAGKSSLLATISQAKPCIANYPFTTINPQLGTLKYTPTKSLIIADIPGIIQGASQGKGLGIRFLKHIERTKVLLFVIIADKHFLTTYHQLLDELNAYNPDLIKKKHLLVASKIDLCPTHELPKILESLPKNTFPISSKTQKGIETLKKNIKTLFKKNTFTYPISLS